MKIAISSSGKDLKAQIDQRFGRCAYFIIVDTEDMSFEAYDNESIGLSGGAGIQAASFVAEKGAGAVLTGHCGPNAMTAFSAAGLLVYTGQSGTVEEAVQRFKAGGLIATTQPTVAEKAGAARTFGGGLLGSDAMGLCRGGGRGKGLGLKRGMGGGGRVMGVGQGVGPAATPQISREETLASLKKEADDLQRRMAAIQEKIAKLE